MDWDFVVLMLKAIALSLGLHATGLLLDAIHASDAVTVSVEGLYMIAMSVFVVVHTVSPIKSIIRNTRLRREIRSAR